MNFKRCLIFVTFYSFLIFSIFAKSNSRSISGGSKKADSEALAVLSETSSDYSIEKTESGDYIFHPTVITDSTGFIFYPGGKVKCEAYLPLMKTIAEKGILCILVYMPRELAVYNPKAAKKFEKQFPEIENWFIGGHSLGGAIAASYVANKAEKYKGLILYAAYATEKVDDRLRVLSIFGTNDQVLNLEKYQKYRKNLPKDFQEILIEGGCHSYFGNYGMQPGDGIPSISREAQQEFAAKITVDFFNE